MTPLSTGLTHGTAVAVNGAGLLILGISGSGKSGLALQMLALGARLIADDQVDLVQTETGVALQTPPTIAGQIEARYFGILSCPFIPRAPARLVVSLDHVPERRLPKARKIMLATREIDLIYGKDVPNLASVLMLHLQHFS